MFHGKTPLLESLITKQKQKRDSRCFPAQVLSCEYCEAFKNTHFKEHLRTSASVHVIQNFHAYGSHEFQRKSQKIYRKSSVTHSFTAQKDFECLGCFPDTSGKILMEYFSKQCQKYFYQKYFINTHLSILLKSIAPKHVTKKHGDLYRDRQARKIKMKNTVSMIQNLQQAEAVNGVVF